MLTYSVPENVVGMTKVLLHRAGSFAELSGRQTDVLTVDADMDFVATKERLDAQGFLGDSNVRLRNLWREMGELSDVHLSRLIESSDSSFVEDAAVHSEGSNNVEC